MRVAGKVSSCFNLNNDLKQQARVSDVPIAVQYFYGRTGMRVLQKDAKVRSQDA